MDVRSLRAAVTPKPCVIVSLGQRLKRVPTDTRSGAGEPTRLPVRRRWPRPTADIPRTEGASGHKRRFDGAQAGLHERTCRVRAVASGFSMLRVHRDRSCCGAVLDAEFRVDLLEMLVDGARAQAQNLRDVAVGLALRQP